ncbi:MAG: D-alanyl-D-alanine carboxypeptidase family protein, partial [Alphaproteobacteria bacterium]
MTVSGWNKVRFSCRFRQIVIFLAFATVAAAAGQANARNASIVVDFETGRVLHAVNPDVRNYPASLTKMMTLYMAFEAIEKGRLKMSQALPVSARAAAARPSKLGLTPGSTISAHDAILAMMTKSANDAAVVVAEALGKTEHKFSQMMTRKAHELGMDRTNFRNASGLPNRRQLSTARDMATLAKHLLTDFPEKYRLFSTPEFEYDGRRYRNHNALLESYPGVDGVKTGYTNASGYNLVASAKRNGHRIIGVVFGGKS